MVLWAGITDNHAMIEGKIALTGSFVRFFYACYTCHSTITDNHANIRMIEGTKFWCDNDPVVPWPKYISYLRPLVRPHPAAN